MWTYIYIWVCVRIFVCIYIICVSMQFIFARTHERERQELPQLNLVERFWLGAHTSSPRLFRLVCVFHSHAGASERPRVSAPQQTGSLHSEWINYFFYKSANVIDLYPSIQTRLKQKPMLAACPNYDGGEDVGQVRFACIHGFCVSSNLLWVDIFFCRALRNKNK